MVRALHCLYLQAESPSSGGFTAIGFYLLVSLFFLTSAFIESIYAIYLVQRKKKYRLLEKSVTKWKRQIDTNNTGNSEWNSTMEAPQKSDPKEEHAKSYEVDIQRIDFYAFIISSCSFLIFNIGYWVTFLVINFD